MFQTAANGPPLFALKHECNLDRRPSRAIVFRDFAIPCRMDTYVLRRDCVIKAMRSA